MHAPPGDICRVGRKVTIGHGVIIHSKFIGDYAVIGMGATLSILAEVGAESIVAEGSTVTLQQVIPSGVVVGGSPAAVLKNVTEMNKATWAYGKQLYIDLAKEYLHDGMHRIDIKDSPTN